MGQTTTSPVAAPTTYRFGVVLEPDDDVWHASCPTLRAFGAATWGRTRDEALHNIREVVGMVVRELVEDGDPVPAEAQPIEEPSVAVSI